MQVQHSALSVCSLAGGFLFPNLFEVTFLRTERRSVGFMMKMWMGNLSKNLLPCDFQNLGLQC